jgi:hypothetical protein
MTTDELKEILARGEDITTEYKKCKDELGNSVYETVCSFSNRYGGYMILGADDDGTVLGVNPDAAAIMKKNFADALNNAQKMFPTLHISLEQAEIDGKTILSGSMCRRPRRCIAAREGFTTVMMRVIMTLPTRRFLSAICTAESRDSTPSGVLSPMPPKNIFGSICCRVCVSSPFPKTRIILGRI